MSHIDVDGPVDAGAGIPVFRAVRAVDVDGNHVWPRARESCGSVQRHYKRGVRSTAVAVAFDKHAVDPDGGNLVHSLKDQPERVATANTASTAAIAIASTSPASGERKVLSVPKW